MKAITVSKHFNISTPAINMPIDTIAFNSVNYADTFNGEYTVKSPSLD